MSLIISFFKVNSYKLIILILGVLTQGFAFAHLSLEQKIGQLIVIPACELRGEDHLADLKDLIERGWVGGILFKQGTAEGQRALIDKLQAIAPIPLLCLQDAEWGVAMRLEGTISFPRHLTLGAIQDQRLLYRLGQEIGRQCGLIGAHLSLVPVVDVNCNAHNPIIHMRSFGEDPEQVAKRGLQLMRGIQSTGVMACAKHFPGHGDTTIDSHVDLPIIAHLQERLHNVELYPFKKLIEADVQAIMTAHLYVEAFSETALQPATFSHRIVTDLLQTQMGFRGLVVSDALNMQALTKRNSPGQIAIKSLLAGHDLLLYGDHIAPNVDQILRVDVPEAFAALKTAVENGQIPEELLDQKVYKILQAKSQLLVPSAKENVTEQINSPEAYALKKKLFEEAITVVRNEGIIPLKAHNIALILWGESSQFVAKFNCDVLSLSDPQLLNKLQNYSCFILVLSQFSNIPPHFGLQKDQFKALAECGIPSIAVVFGTPYSLAWLPLFDAIVVAYENDPDAQEAAADVLLGRLKAKGKLPVSVDARFQWGARME